MSEARSAALADLTAGTIERWSLPAVEGPVIGGRPRDERKAAAAAEAIARVARQESEARGYEEGLARAQVLMQPRIAELEQRVQRLDAVLKLLSGPLRELDAQVEKDLVQLALAVGKQLARRELRIDPSQVIAIIRESLGQLPSAAREVRVHLHPDDAAIVRERLTAPAHERAWTLIEDPTLARGGCVVRAESSQIDARLETRVNAVIAATLGDDRALERHQAAEGTPMSGTEPHGAEPHAAHSTAPSGAHGTASHGVHGTASHGAHGTASDGVHGTASHGAHGTASHGAHGTASHGAHGTTPHGAHGTALHATELGGAALQAAAMPTGFDS